MKQLTGRVLAIAVCTLLQIGCNSKPSDKAEHVEERKEDVIEAQERGDTADVRDDQAKLDSARKDYKEAVRDSVNARKD